MLLNARQATLDDWRVVVEIIASCERKLKTKKAGIATDIEDQLESLARTIPEQIKQGKVWVAEYNGRLVAACLEQEFYAENSDIKLIAAFKSRLKKLI